MTAKINRSMNGESWVKMPRDLLRSDAWRSLSINARRFIDFLLIEHLSRGGKHNGQLKAPHRQLAYVGVGERRVAPAIREAEETGLVDCVRGGMRVATTYCLTWLPLHDGKAPSHRWREYQNPSLREWPTAKNKNLPDKGTAALPDKGTADDINLPDKGTADRPKSLPDKGTALSRKYSTRAEDIISELEVGGGDARPPWSTPTLIVLPDEVAACIAYAERAACEP